jgi:hypothetical protein
MKWPARRFISLPTLSSYTTGAEINIDGGLLLGTQCKQRRRPSGAFIIEYYLAPPPARQAAGGHPSFLSAKEISMKRFSIFCPLAVDR